MSAIAIPALNVVARKVPSPTPIRGPVDLTPAIIAYEAGELDEYDTVELFKQLVATGLAWRLQGHYGRTAAALINAGIISL